MYVYYGRKRLAMMKKLSVGILLFMLTLVLQQGKTEASEFVITANQDRIPIYASPSGDFNEIGKLRLGESMIVTKSFDSDWWQVRFGNAHGYIEKNVVHLQKNVEVPSENRQANTNKVVIINQDADVYDNSSGTLKKFAVVNEGNRYPVLSIYGNWWRIDVGGRVGFLHKSSTSIDTGIPVLMYHHILTAEEKADSPYADRNSTTINTQFNEQMDYLKENGFTTISTEDLEAYLNGKINLPAKSVVLTLDDGNISSRVYAYPKLKELGFVADQFIITGRTPEKPYIFDPQRLRFLSQQEMNEMSDVFNYYGHSHALHALTSSNESFLTAKDKEAVSMDLLYNRELLNDTTYFAYPFGQYNKDAIEIVRDVGFTMAYTTQMGRARLGINKLLIPRMGISPHLSIEEFAKRVNN